MSWSARLATFSISVSWCCLTSLSSFSLLMISCRAVMRFELACFASYLVYFSLSFQSCSRSFIFSFSDSILFVCARFYALSSANWCVKSVNRLFLSYIYFVRLFISSFRRSSLERCGDWPGKKFVCICGCTSTGWKMGYDRIPWFWSSTDKLPRKICFSPLKISCYSLNFCLTGEKSECKRLTKFTVSLAPLVSLLKSGGGERLTELEVPFWPI